MRSGWYTGLVAFALAVICVSCVEQMPADDELGPSRPADRFGLLAVSYGEHRAPGGIDPQIVVAGYFARHVGLTRDEVIHTLNVPDVPDSHLLGIPAGSCRLMDRPLGSSNRDADTREAFVDLLDGGEVSVHMGSRAQRLNRRTVPDIFAHVAGVTYEGILHDVSGTSGAATVRVEGRGSYEMGDFIVELPTPPVPRLVEVAGQPVVGEYAAIDWESNLPIRWLAREADGTDGAAAARTARALVHIELVALRFDRLVSLRCTTRDDGSAGLPAEGVAAVGRAATPDASVHLIIRRIAHEPFGAAGIHAGDVYFVSRDSVLVQ